MIFKKAQKFILAKLFSLNVCNYVTRLNKIRAPDLTLAKRVDQYADEINMYTRYQYNFVTYD